MSCDPLRSYRIVLFAVALAATGPFVTTEAAWIDTATGQPVQTNPLSGNAPGSGGSVGARDPADPNHAHLADGRNLFWDEVCHTWNDSATGKEVKTNPVSGYAPGSGASVGAQDPADPNHAHLADGRNLVWVPCPPPTQTAGVYLGGEILKNIGRSTLTEESAATGAVTNQFDETGDPLGGGIVIGDNFKLSNRNLIVGPFAAFDFLNQTINHTFTSSTFLGTTTHWTLAAGAKAGIVTSSGVVVYGRGAISWLNEDLNINFGGPVTSSTTTVRGFQVGGGAEFAPSAWKTRQHPLSIFVEFQHSSWQDASLFSPAASPAFNYNFPRQDETIKAGVNFHLRR